MTKFSGSALYFYSQVFLFFLCLVRFLRTPRHLTWHQGMGQLEQSVHCYSLTCVLHVYNKTKHIYILIHVRTGNSCIVVAIVEKMQHRNLTVCHKMTWLYFFSRLNHFFRPSRPWSHCPSSLLAAVLLKAKNMCWSLMISYCSLTSWAILVLYKLATSYTINVYTASQSCCPCFFVISCWQVYRSDF